LEAGSGIERACTDGIGVTEEEGGEIVIDHSATKPRCGYSGPLPRGKVLEGEFRHKTLSTSGDDGVFPGQQQSLLTKGEYAGFENFLQGPDLSEATTATISAKATGPADSRRRSAVLVVRMMFFG